MPRAGNNGDDALRIYRDDGILRSSLQYNGDADFRTITVSNIQGGSPLTIGAGADTINIQSNMIMVGGSILTATTIQCATLTTESGVNSNLLASNIIASNLVQGSNLSATNFFLGDGGLLSNTAAQPNLQGVTDQGAVTTATITTGGLEVGKDTIITSYIGKAAIGYNLSLIHI